MIIVLSITGVMCKRIVSLSEKDENCGGAQTPTAERPKSQKSHKLFKRIIYY